MKVLYYFLNLPTMMYQWQKFHIIDEMADHNCDIKIVSPLTFSSVVEANEVLINLIKNGRYDLFMTCLTEEYIFKDTILEIKKLGVPTLLFCPDNLVVPFNHKSIAPLFDVVWLTSFETEYLFKRWGCNTVFQPYAANPKFLIPTYSGTEILRVGFIGTPHGSRINRINTLLNANIPVTIHTDSESVDNRIIKTSMKNYLRSFYYNSRFPIGRKLLLGSLIDKFHHSPLIDQYNCLERKPAVPLNSLAKVNGEYALVLSFTDANSTGMLKNPVKIVNLRNFEVPMSGAVQFTIYSDEMASYFEDDKEIVMGKSLEELIDKARFYLKEENKDLRKQIRLAARRRAAQEHTWSNRFSIVFSKLNLK